MGAKGEEVGQLADGWEGCLAKDLGGTHLRILRQIQFHTLHIAGQVRHHQNPLLLVALPNSANKGQHLAIVRIEKLKGSLAKGAIALANGDQALHRPPEGIGVVAMGLGIDGFVVIFRINDDGQIELLGIGPRESGVAVGTPLHRSPHPIAIPQIDVVPHGDLVAIVENRRTGQ